MSALPAHWATRYGLGREPSSELSIQELRRRQKARALAVAVAAPQAPSPAEPAGLVKLLNKSDRATAASPQGGAAAALAESSEILEFSSHEARMRRMSTSVRASCRIHAAAARSENVAALGAAELPAMFTLTHRPGQKPDPRDVTRFVDCVRKWVLRKFGQGHLRYVWVAELQADRALKGDEGAVHYHVCCWLPAELHRKVRHGWKPSSVLPKPDTKRWWTKGKTERDWVQKSVTSYLSKYLSKGEASGFPKGLRIHGAGGFNADQRASRSYLCLPAWLAKQVMPADRCVRLPAGVWTYPDGRREFGGGWVSRRTGECFRSPWVLLSFGTKVRIAKRFSSEVDVAKWETKATAPEHQATAMAA